MKKKVLISCAIIFVFISVFLAIRYFNSDRKKIIINNFIPEQNSTHTAYVNDVYYYYDETSGFSGIKKLKGGNTENFLKTESVSCISATKENVYFVADSILYQANNEGDMIAEVELNDKYEYISMASKADYLMLYGVVLDENNGTVDESVMYIFSLKNIKNEKVELAHSNEKNVKVKTGIDQYMGCGIDNYYLYQKGLYTYLEGNVEERRVEPHENYVMIYLENGRDFLCCYDKQTGNKLLNISCEAFGINEDGILILDPYSYYRIHGDRFREIANAGIFESWNSSMDMQYAPAVKLHEDCIVVIAQTNEVHSLPFHIGARAEANEKLKDHVRDYVVLMDVKDGKRKTCFKTKQGEKILYADSEKVLTFYNDAYRLYDYDKNVLKKIDSKKYGKSGNYYAELCKDIVFIYKNDRVIDKIEL